MQRPQCDPQCDSLRPPAALERLRLRAVDNATYKMSAEQRSQNKHVARLTTAHVGASCCYVGTCNRATTKTTEERYEIRSTQRLEPCNRLPVLVTAGDQRLHSTLLKDCMAAIRRLRPSAVRKQLPRRYRLNHLSHACIIDRCFLVAAKHVD